MSEPQAATNESIDEARRRLKERLMKRAKFSEKDAEEAAKFWTAPITDEDEQALAHSAP